ncbi:MAG: M20/M25/M40 family metallo-hydrolase [Firmicutes bacterium]|nr:M20/M25/M40 family metallo-hydrolase [Bacillota bacterium]
MNLKYDPQLYTEHLIKMCQVPTVSSADHDKTRVAEFEKLHKVLEECYPTVHKKMKKEIVGLCGLLYHFESNHASGKLPLMLIAHQDVVPEGDHSMWNYPPYACELHDGILTGRGVTDSKNNIMGYMDALELLFNEGWEPDYDLYLGYGYNEEVMGAPGAAAPQIVAVLESRGVKLGALIDECGGINAKKDGGWFGEIDICEKGYLDVEFSALDNGGHSCAPAKKNALVKLAETMIAIDENPMPPFMSPVVVTQLKAQHKHGLIANDELDALCDDVEGNWDKIVAVCEKDRLLNPLIRTTSAITMCEGSAQANIIPEKATLIVNNRILPGQTKEDLLAHFEKLLPEGVTMRVVKGDNPPAVQSVESNMFKMLEGIVADMYDGAPLIPMLLTGGTDSRYYCGICPTDSCYRFTGMKHDGRSGGAHQVNEHVAVDILAADVEMYVNILTRYSKEG